MSAPSLPLSHFDPSVRIQDDLYRHVNGRWLDTEPIPEDKPATGAFQVLRDASEEAVHDICEGLLAAGDLDAEQTKIATLYGDFLAQDALETLDDAPLRPVLERIAAIASVDDLRAHLGWTLRHGLGSLIGIEVDSDPGDPHRYLLFVGQSGIGLPDESYYREDQHAQIREKYVAHIGRTLALVGLDPADAPAVFDLETAIAATHWDRVRTRDIKAMYNLRSRAKLAAEAPEFGWERLLTAADIDDRAAEIVSCQPSFFTEVSALFTEDRLPAWRTWATFHAVSSLSPYLSSRFVDERFDFYGRTLQGIPVLKARWKRAVALAEGVLGEAIGREYVARHFPPAAKQRMDTLVATLIEAYRLSISELDWMTPATKAEALAKLARFTPKIAYPNRWRTYENLALTPGDLVGNVLAAGSFELDYNLDKLPGQIDPDEWLMFPQTVNAYYHPLRNEIVFPAAILQPPFFNFDADDAVNYGGIGAVIGHEIGHGFDDQGSMCDGEGRLRDWWTADDREAFENRTKSLIDQYSQLEPEQTPGHRVNGELTIGENIGDLGGLGIAIKAWRLATGGDVPEVDGYTGLQRLFLSWAAVWASKSRDELVLQRLATDPHSPPEFRCNQIVRNLDEFYAAFDVRPDDGLWLDPEQRVTIW